MRKPLAVVALATTASSVAATGPSLPIVASSLAFGYIAIRAYEILQAAADVTVSAIINTGAAVEAATEHIVGAAADEAAGWARWSIAAAWTTGLAILAVAALWCCRAIQKGIGKGSSTSCDGDGPSQNFELSPSPAPLALTDTPCELVPAEADPYDGMLAPVDGVITVGASDVDVWRDLQRQLTISSISNALLGTRGQLAQKLERKQAVKLMLGYRTNNYPCITGVVRGTYPYVQHIPAGSLLAAECDCPDFQRTGLLCKHGGAVLLVLHNSRIVAAEDLAGPPAAASGSGREAALPLEDAHRPTAAAAVRALREVTLERDQLSSELALAREQLAQSAGEAGLPPRILDAATGQTSRVAAIRSAKTYVYLAAFTYDLDDVTEALASARSRCSKLDIKVLIDQEQAMTGSTRNLRPRVMQLVSRGVQVRLLGGQRLHAKVLLTDVGAYIGSLNFTRASLNNVERVVSLHLRGSAEKAEKDWFLDLWRRAKDFDGKTAVPTTPPR